MGYINHHAVFITSFDDEGIKAAHEKAIQLFGEQVSNIVKGKRNDYKSFFIGPDGSKEGWDASQEGDSSREEFVFWLKSNNGGERFLYSEAAILSYDEEGDYHIETIY